MSTRPTSLREVQRRIECGVTGINDAAFLTELLERIIYPQVDNYAEPCRICSLPRHMGHAKDCAALEVD